MLVMQLCQIQIVSRRIIGIVVILLTCLQNLFNHKSSNVEKSSSFPKLKESLCKQLSFIQDKCFSGNNDCEIKQHGACPIWIMAAILFPFPKCYPSLCFQENDKCFYSWRLCFCTFAKTATLLRNLFTFFCHSTLFPAISNNANDFCRYKYTWLPMKYCRHFSLFPMRSSCFLSLTNWRGNDQDYLKS